MLPTGDVGPPLTWRNYRFGGRWDAASCDYLLATETPVGAQCMECGERIRKDDRGLVMPFVSEGSGTWQPVHLECHLRGTASHLYEQCRCYVPGRSVRAEALATLAAINAQRAEQGHGPL